MTKPAARPAVASPEASTTTEAIFQAVLVDIVQGKYPPGARLPAERELARMLGGSRPTLREALRKLTEWGLVEPRRGSGVVVRDRREWSIDVLPTYIRHGKPQPGEASIPQTLLDLLALRRTTMREVARMVAGRIPPGGMAAPRKAVQEAWDSREDLQLFATTDFEFMRALVEAADFFPAIWFLNRLSHVYLDIAHSLSGTLPPPENYLEAHGNVMDELEKGNGDAAAELLDAYLKAHDDRLMEPLKVFI